MNHDLARVPNIDALGFDLPRPEEGLIEAKRHLAQTFRPNEMIWIVAETYDPITPSWQINVVRQGTAGRWVRQRTRFDQQANVLYYLGETALSDAEFRAVRSKYQRFPISEWQQA